MLLHALAVRTTEFGSKENKGRYLEPAFKAIMERDPLGSPYIYLDFQQSIAPPIIALKENVNGKDKHRWLAYACNYKGACGEQWWPDALCGPNPEAVAQLLIAFLHSGGQGRSLSSSYLSNQAPGIFTDAINALVEHEKLEALPGVLAPLEALMLCAPHYTAVSCSVYLPLLLSYFTNMAEFWALLDPPDDGIVERMLALACAITRLAVLFPDVAFPECLSWVGESNLPCYNLLALQEFLDKTSSAHRSVEATPAWAWHAVDPTNAQRSTPEAAQASATVGTHAGIAVTEKDAKAIPVRRHLLKYLAGPVTQMSATAEATARAMACPSMALQAHLLRLRLQRALEAVGGNLYDAEIVGDLKAAAKDALDKEHSASTMGQ